jgi:hypothetical protein
MLDALGERYGMLPSQVLEQGNTLDLWVFDVAVSYKNHVHKEEMRKHDKNSAASIDPQTLQKGFEKFHGSKTK